MAETYAGFAYNAKGEYDLWQHIYWKHTIRDETDFAKCAGDIHFNPVEHALVKQESD